MKKSLLLASLLLMPVFALASTSPDYPVLSSYLNSLYAFTHGAYGTGLAVFMLLAGGAVGVAHCGPGATLAGVLGAAAINWGPTVLMTIFGVPVPADPLADKSAVVAHVAVIAPQRAASTISTK